MARRVAASCGCTKRSPAFGALPPGRNAAAPVARSFSALRAQSAATRGVTGKPSSANRIAGCSTSSSAFVPCARSSVSHAATAPGTVTPCGELSSSSAMPRASNQSMLAPAGARPEPLSATTRRSPADA